MGLPAYGGSAAVFPSEHDLDHSPDQDGADHQYEHGGNQQNHSNEKRKIIEEGEHIQRGDRAVASEAMDSYDPVLGPVEHARQLPSRDGGNSMTHATVLVAGRADENCLGEVAEALRDRGVTVEPGVLNGHPALEGALAACVQSGAGRIAILPFFFQEDDRILHRIRQRVDGFRKDHPGLDIHVAPSIGFDPRLVDIADDYIARTYSALDGNAAAAILKIEGCIAKPLFFTYADIDGIPDRIDDIGRLLPGRNGSAIFVRRLLANVTIDATVSEVVFHSADDEFFARIPLERTLANGILVYRMDGHPLPERLGGPVRLFVPETDDRCANVKNVVRIELVA